MSLKKYDVVENGYPTTLLLSDADAAQRGLTPRDKAAKTESSSTPPAKKAAAKKTAAKKAPAKKAASAPANKARGDVPNKDA